MVKVKVFAVSAVAAATLTLTACQSSTSGSSGGSSGGSISASESVSTASTAIESHPNPKEEDIPPSDLNSILDRLGGDDNIIRNSGSNAIDSGLCPDKLTDYDNMVRQLDTLNKEDEHATDMQLTAKNLLRNPGNCIGVGGGKGD